MLENPVSSLVDGVREHCMLRAKAGVETGNACSWLLRDQTFEWSAISQYRYTKGTSF